MKRMPPLLAFLAFGHALRPRTNPDVYWVEMEGGAATPIKTPAGESILIDNGIPLKNPDRHRRNPIFPQLIKPYRDMKVENRHVVQPGYVYPLKQAKGSTRIRVTCVTANPKKIQSPTNVRLPRKLLTGTEPEKPEDLSDNVNSVITLTDSKNCKGHFIKLSVSSDGKP